MSDTNSDITHAQRYTLAIQCQGRHSSIPARGRSASSTTDPPVAIPGAENLSVHKRAELYGLWRAVLAAHNLGDVWRFTLWELIAVLDTEKISRV